MLKHGLLHPAILAALGRAGHHAKVLIADGNFPASTTLGPRAELVSLNLAPGVVTVAQVLRALVGAVPFEEAYVMGSVASDPYARRTDPPVWKEFRAILKKAGGPGTLQVVPKPDFYPFVRTAEHALTIQTADQALFANLLLTVGVRKG